MQELMTTRETIVWAAKQQIGYKETGTNLTKYGKAFGLDGKAWCGMFVSWIYAKCGVPLPKIGFSKPGFASCQKAARHFAEAGMLTVDPQPADIVFYDWDQNGWFDHTGIFVRKVDANNFEAIEGNTSVGNNSNGGQVMLRKRKFSQAIFVSAVKT